MLYEEEKTDSDHHGLVSRGSQTMHANLLAPIIHSWLHTTVHHCAVFLTNFFLSVLTHASDIFMVHTGLKQAYKSLCHDKFTSF